MRFRAPWIVAAAGLLIAADDPPKEQGQGQRDPQAAVEPRSAPGAGHKLKTDLSADFADDRRWRDRAKPRALDRPIRRSIHR